MPSWMNRFKADQEWQEFLQAKLPIFWVIGPSQSGKTTLAHVLSEASNYRLVHVKHLASSGKAPDYMKLLKAEIKHTFRYCPGYIIDDFPANMSECRKFEKKIGEPTVVIYIWISLDAVLARALALHPTMDIHSTRQIYVQQSKFCEQIAQKYEKVNKIVRIFSQYPIRDTHAKALEILETEFSYKFNQFVKPAA